MVIKLFEECDCGVGDCGGYDYIVFDTKLFKFKFFDDNGYKFVVLEIGNKMFKRNF